MTFKEVGAEFPEMWKPEKEGDSIEGTYAQKKLEVGKNKSTVYILDCDGTPRSLWSSTVLDDKMTYCTILDKIKITYQGEDEEKGYKKFKVEKDMEDKED